MLEGSSTTNVIRGFITRALIHDPDYPLEDDEPLLSGGLIDMAALEELSEFIEETFGVSMDESELTTENIDTLQDIVDLLDSRIS